MLAPATTRTVIGGVGYRNLRDHSLGIVMSDELEPYARPPELLIEDLCYGPVAVGQWLLDEALVAPITRAVFVTAVAREDGRPPGTISAYRWDRVLPSDEEIQRAVTDAVTGVIPGARTPAQSQANAAADALPPLSADTMAAAREVYDRLVAPHVHGSW